MFHRIPRLLAAILVASLLSMGLGSAPSMAGTSAIRLPQLTILSSYNFDGLCVRHFNFLGELNNCPAAATGARDFIFRMVKGLAPTPKSKRKGVKVSFASVNFPGYYLRHENGRIKLIQKPAAGAGEYSLFLKDATFYLVPGLADRDGTSFESYNYRGFYLRHRDFHLWVEKKSTPNLKADATFYLNRPSDLVG
jgi:hypothetical protein